MNRWRRFNREIYEYQVGVLDIARSEIFKSFLNDIAMPLAGAREPSNLGEFIIYEDD